jgi:hypothetical protein
MRTTQARDTYAGGDTQDDHNCHYNAYNSIGAQAVAAVVIITRI